MAGKTHLSLTATPGRARTFTAKTSFVRDYTANLRTINIMDFDFIVNNMFFTFTANVVYKG